MKKLGIALFVLCLIVLEITIVGSQFANSFVATETSEVQNNQPQIPSIPSSDKKPSAQVTTQIVALEKPVKSVIVLGAANTLVFRAVVTQDSVAKAQFQLFKMSQLLPKDAVIYLVMDTPGGDIDAGNMLIESAKALPQEVKTITLFSASMGFHTVENLGERLVLPNGVLMSHRARAGEMGGEVPGNLIVRVNALLRLITVMDTHASARMGISLKAYQELIRDEYWVTGQDAVDARAADRVVLARCSDDLLGTHKESVNTMFGRVGLIYADCPLIRYPLDVELPASSNLTPAQKAEFEKFVFDMTQDKESFVRNQIVNNHFKKMMLVK
jgi:ATP-dependent protease ClpP protease subunit